MTFLMGSTDHTAQIPAVPPLSPETLGQLKAAAAAGDLDALRSFFDERAKQPAYDQCPLELFHPVLCAALENHQVGVVSFLLDQAVPMREFLLQRAAQLRSIEALQAFIDHGWDINTPCGLFTPPALCYVVEDERLVTWFLGHGADPGVRCKGADITPLSWAVQSAPLSTVKLLLQHEGAIHNGQLLHFASTRQLPDRVEVVAFLLDSGASESINNVMYQDKPDDYLMNMYTDIGTPLHLAAKCGFLDLVRFLLSKGADPLVRDPRGKIALDRAQYAGHTDIVNFLLPLSESSTPRPCFTDTPGYHYKTIPLHEFDPDAVIAR